MSHFRQCDRDTPYLLPPSVDDWLPKDHLARFVVDIVLLSLVCAQEHSRVIFSRAVDYADDATLDALPQ